MLDFFRVAVKEPRGKSEVFEVFPDFVVGRSRDLMVQGGSFYAIWDEEAGLWSRDEYDVQRLVDQALREEAEKMKDEGLTVKVKYLSSFGNGGWKQFRAFVKNVSDNSHPLDAKLTFLNTPVKRSDYVSRRLQYNLAQGSIEAYNELAGTLYSPEEREKFEWALGAIIAGDAKRIQKFLVFYGAPGTGKSTIMDIAYKMFGGLVEEGGYAAMFDAKALVGNNNAFSTESFKDNPLIAIQHDGDLSRIEDNTKLNSIVSHEQMRINEKYKATYDTKINAFLFLGTNKPVMITDSKAGLIRRLIDVNPTGVTFEPDRYFELTSRIDFEIGAIAYHCLEVYKKLGRSYYSGYKPIAMMLKTDVFFNYVEAHYDVFSRQEYVTLTQAWELYKNYAEDAELQYKTQKHKFREQLKDYFEEFHDRFQDSDGSYVRSVYKVFTAKQFKEVIPKEESKTGEVAFRMVIEGTESLFDEMYTGMPAQYTKTDGTPRKRWDSVKTTLGDLDTSQLHFVKVPENHIVIDFDLKGDDGEKSLERNLEAASTWPPTYAELSKSGAGVHLHYYYDGDASELAPVYSEGIEIKVYTGNSSLRRRLSKCNDVHISTLNSGLPFKEKKLHPKSSMQTEDGIRNLIKKNLRKEIHPGTKPSMDFIEHVLNQAYESGVQYDVSNMMPQIMAFANNSQKNAEYCLKVVARIAQRLKSDPSQEELELPNEVYEPTEDERIVFFDCEVYPNLFVICWKYHGTNVVSRMINPTPTEVERLFKNKLVGYNNRSYDNHIIYARSIGSTNEELYRLSQQIITENDPNAKFAMAYNLSYADVYDFSVKKQGLKKWEIELGIPHIEMDIPWDEPVKDEDVLRVVEYCCNDVNALEALFDHLQNDFAARKIIADMSGLPVNATTRKHTERILFMGDRNPQKKFVYTDLSETFPGYKFNPYSKTEKSTYRGEVVGEGGYVYAEPGIYYNVALLDIASMHPTSIEELNLFGPYMANFSKIKAARLAIKNANASWKKGLDGDAKKFLQEANELLPGVEVTKDNAGALAEGLKLVINSIYGYTSATFPNAFRDPRNVDNIVAKRGALFMVDLKNALQEQGIKVVHIKTDSVKIPDATPDVIAFVQEFGAKYGYTFEHEATYERMCLVNDAVYVAKYPSGEWTATGAEFKHPYVFKTLFTGEAITFKDLCETKQVKEGVIYLEHEEGDVFVGKEDISQLDHELSEHIGRTGLFVPVHKEAGGGKLMRVKDGKKYAVTGTKGWYWLEADTIRSLHGEAIERMEFERLEDSKPGTGSVSDMIDMAYFSQLAEDAAQSIEEFGEFEKFAEYTELVTGT